MNKHIDRRRISAGLALTTMAVSALLVLTGCSKVPDTIKIGVAQPLSGPLGALGQDLLNGVNLAVAELNKFYGLQMEAVHYRGEAPMWQDLMAGVIQGGSGSVAAASAVLQAGVGIPIAVPIVKGTAPRVRKIRSGLYVTEMRRIVRMDRWT